MNYRNARASACSNPRFLFIPSWLALILLINCPTYLYSSESIQPIQEQPEGQKAKSPQSPHPEFSAPTEKLAQMPRPHQFELGLEISHIRNGEPDPFPNLQVHYYMEENGVMRGLYGDYVFHPKRFMFKLDGRYTLGKVNYSNPISKYGDIRDYNFETRFLFGQDFKVSEKGHLTPFVGAGYRFLFDGLASKSIESDKRSHFFYSPIGLEATVQLGKSWSVSPTAEYDHFWHGWLYHEGFGQKVANNQKNGWGARASLKIIKNLGRIDFAIEPYFRYWSIDRSDEVYPRSGVPGDLILGVTELANTSTEWGTRLGIRF